MSNKKVNRTIFVGPDIYYSQEYVDKIVKSANDYYDIIHKIKENCIWSIYSINNILTLNKICPFTKDGKILRNRYQEVRLKAFKSKCKEILKLIEESEDKE